MITAFQTIAKGIVAALAGAPALAAGRVFANRLRPLPAGVTSAIVVRLDKAVATEVVLGINDWDSAYVVECYARGSVSNDPADAVDALLGDAWARLAGLDAATLGAESLALNPAIDWQYDEADGPVACASIRLRVQHRTPVATLTAWS